MSYLNKKYLSSALRNSALYTEVLNAKPNSEQEEAKKHALVVALEKDIFKELDEFMESFEKSIAADREEKKKMQEEASAKEELLNAIKKYNDVTKDDGKIKVVTNDNGKIKINYSGDSINYDPRLWGFIDDLFSLL